MAANLQKGGHELVVHDLTRQAASQHLTQWRHLGGERRAPWPRPCDLVFTSLPTPADVRGGRARRERV